MKALATLCAATGMLLFICALFLFANYVIDEQRKPAIVDSRSLRTPLDVRGGHFEPGAPDDPNAIHFDTPIVTTMYLKMAPLPVDSDATAFTVRVFDDTAPTGRDPHVESKFRDDGGFDISVYDKCGNLEWSWTIPGAQLACVEAK